MRQIYGLYQISFKCIVAGNATTFGFRKIHEIDANTKFVEEQIVRTTIHTSALCSLHGLNYYMVHRDSPALACNQKIMKLGKCHKEAL